MKKILAFVLALMMVMGVTPIAALAQGETADTIRVIVPPVSGTYQNQLEGWAKDFNALYPNLTLEFETGSWEDYNDKLSVQINAGSPPDIAEINYGKVGAYLETGLLVDISTLATEEMIADYDEGALNYFRMNGGLYGFPIYNVIQSIGGNKAMLEAAGADLAKIQSEGWTFEEFKEIVKAGTKDGAYGFVFANSGVAAGDFLSIFAASAGMASAFDDDLKYTYTSKNFLNLLQDVSDLITEGYMPKQAIEAGQRWNMFLTGKAMIFGKAMALFEMEALENNDAIAKNDGSAVEGSIETEFVFLPVPMFDGQPQGALGNVDGFAMFRSKDTTDEHLQNVIKALYFMASGQRAGYTCGELYLGGVSKSARDALDAMESPYPRDENNNRAGAYMAAHATAPNFAITSELSSSAQRIMDEVVVPKFQALIAGECTAQDMYDEIYSTAVEVFGEDGIVKD